MRHTRQTEGHERADSRWKWSLIGFLAVTGFFLWTEHRAHLLGVLPYLLVLACPLMHIFHHGGHGHHRRGGTDGADGQQPQVPKPGGRS